MTPENSLACNMGVFTPEQRESHIQMTTKLIQAVQDIREVENGFEFSFPNQAEFISNERLCCPFLGFTLQVNSNQDPVSLRLTGPLGTPEFLRAEFDGAFQ